MQQKWSKTNDATYGIFTVINLYFNSSCFRKQILLLLQNSPILQFASCILQLQFFDGQDAKWVTNVIAIYVFVHETKRNLIHILQQDFIFARSFFSWAHRLVKSRSSKSPGGIFSRRSFRCFPMRKVRGGPLSSSTCLSLIKLRNNFHGTLLKSF